MCGRGRKGWPFSISVWWQTGPCLENKLMQNIIIILKSCRFWLGKEKPPGFGQRFGAAPFWVCWVRGLLLVPWTVRKERCWSHWLWWGRQETKGKGNVVGLRWLSVPATSVNFSFTASKKLQKLTWRLSHWGTRAVHLCSAGVLELLRRDGKAAQCSKYPLISFTHPE